jgi:hypothetical protein
MLGVQKLEQADLQLGEGPARGISPRRPWMAGQEDRRLGLEDALDTGIH